MTEKIKNCPFCGGDNINVTTLGGQRVAVCHDCGSRGAGRMSTDGAVCAWNRRSEEEPSADVCWYCGGPLRWNNDYNYDEVYREGEGIVTYLTCTVCGAEVEYSLREDEEE